MAKRVDLGPDSNHALIVKLRESKELRDERQWEKVIEEVKRRKRALPKHNTDDDLYLLVEQLTNALGLQNETTKDDS